MIKHFCDRCRKDCTKKYQIFTLPILESEAEVEKSNGTWTVSTRGDTYLKDFELCDDCIERLIEWRQFKWM